jgi:DUF1365 family protein
MNEFTYSGFFIRFNIEKVDQFKTRFFSINKFNLFSFYTKDHGFRDERPLKEWVHDIFNQAKISFIPDRIELQTFPRVMGYVFNPVSFWYCYKDEKIGYIICEVNNTFGESHNYLLDNDPTRNVVKRDKEFHVSPFYSVEGHYTFNFKNMDKPKIDLYQNNILQLCTYIQGRQVGYNDFELLKLFIKFPLYSVQVLFLIHFQALKLFLKKIKFFSKPVKKDKEVTYEFSN